MTNILIVEHDPHLLALWKRFVSARGLNVATASTAATAATHLHRKAAPALIVLDSTLAHAADASVLELLRQPRFAGTRVVVVSTRPYARHRLHSGDRVDYVLLKPVSPDGLAALLLSLLEQAAVATASTSRLGQRSAGQPNTTAPTAPLNTK